MRYRFSLLLTLVLAAWCRIPGPGATQSAGGEEGPEDPDPARGDADRRLQLASRQGGARGHRLPRSRERLHRRWPEAHHCPAGDALQGDAGPHQGIGPGRARSRRRLLVLHAHRAGKGVSDFLPEEGLARCARRDLSRSERAGRGQEVSRAGRPERQPRRHEADLPGRPHRVSRIHALRERSLPAGRSSSRSRRCGTATRGPTTTRRFST